MSWKGVVTNAGKVLLAEWVNEKTLYVTAARSGSGTVADEALLAQTDLVNRQQTMSIISSVKTDDGRRLRTQLQAPDTAYTMNQIGIWAKLDDGDETLLALYQNDDGVPIPSNTDAPDYVYTFYGTIAVNNEGTITINVDTSAVVPRSDFDSEVARIDDDIATINGKITVKDLGSFEGKTSADVKTSLDTWVQDAITQASESVSSKGEAGSSSTLACSLSASTDWMDLWNDNDTTTTLGSDGVKYTVRLESLDQDKKSAKLSIWACNNEGEIITDEADDDYGFYTLNYKDGNWGEIQKVPTTAPIELLMTMIQNNEFYASITDDDGYYITDDDGYKIQADWKFAIQ